ncbi:MAG: MBL fold metallo-hydrolase [Nocardioides sp.]|uniref:MBL fold metallo-hydrolase n=1 Tax=Nocardioides sp. TaxID=35761 RepID=UPI0039E44ED0
MTKFNPLRAGTSRRGLLRTSALGGVVGLGLADALGATPASAAVGSATADSAGDRLVMLGVDGGPKVNVGRAKPALALVVEDQVYLVDAGANTADQLVAAGLGFATLNHLFLTHHHLDHTSGLMGLLIHGWTYAPSALTGLRMWGPPQMGRFTRGLEAGYGDGIDLYENGGGFSAFPDVRTTDVRVPHASARSQPVARVMEDDLVRVDATRVFHGDEVKDAYAYRFTVKSSRKKVVFSGDTNAPNRALIALAKDADYLVHETQDNDNVEKVVASAPAAQQAALREHLLTSHSDVRDLPRVGRAAGVGTMVMSHYTPLPQDASVYLKKAQRAADRLGYDGALVAPEDLDVIAL